MLRQIKKAPFLRRMSPKGSRWDNFVFAVNGGGAIFAATGEGQVVAKHSDLLRLGGCVFRALRTAKKHQDQREDGISQLTVVLQWLLLAAIISKLAAAARNSPRMSLPVLTADLRIRLIFVW